MAALIVAAAGWPWGFVAVALPCFFLFFFRDPERVIGGGPADVVSPADGRVMIVGDPIGDFAGSTWRQISIFLSPMDVHVNRMPVGGTIMKVQYHPGRFMPAFKAAAGDLNEYTEVTVDHHGETIVFRQIVGILARRIVCRVKEGDQVKAGERMGVMKFGSRMDIFLPLTASIHTKVNDKVVGGRTVVATLGSPAAGSRAAAPR